MNQIDPAAARALVEVASKEGFDETIRLVYNTFTHDESAKLAIDTIYERCETPLEEVRIYNFRASLAIAFVAGSFYAEQARRARELNQLPEIIQ